jgi:glucose-1-phosphate adenylyltransferase
VTDSVILPEVEIERNARINRAIIDRGCTIESGMVIGEDHEQDRKRGFRVTDKGVVLVTPDMLHQSIHTQR